MQIRNPLESPEFRAAISTALGVSSQVLTNWKQRGIPEGKCPSIELATGGKCTVEQMRPDVHWHRVKDKSWPHPVGRPLIDAAKAKANANAEAPTKEAV